MRWLIQILSELMADPEVWLPAEGLIRDWPLLALPVIASRVGSYAEDLRHEETALLVENTPEAWLAALTRWVEDAELPAHLAARGLEWARDPDDRLDRAAVGGAVGPMSADDNLVARTAAHLESVGFALIPLAQLIAGAWDLLAVSPRGLTLIAAVPEKPNVLGTTYGAVPSWPRAPCG